MSKRLLELEPTNLFGDEAILTFLSGREEISRPFDFMLTVASPDDKVKPEKVIGQPLAVRINRDEEEPRYIHGYVSGFWAGDSVVPASGLKIFRMYRIRLVPWLWFLTRASRCFVYLPEKAEKSIQDVLNEVVKRVESYGHVDPKIDAKNAKVLVNRKVEHCVQYRETDFNFLSRTLERYGVYYYFKTTNNNHTLVLSDQLDYPNAVESEVRYPNSMDQRDGEDVIRSWEHAYEFVTGKWEQTDYDFLHPSTDLKVSAQKHSSITLKNNDAYEHYEYPGEYVKKDDGEAEAAIRQEAEELRFNTVTGSSSCKTFSPGHCFKLTEHSSCKDEKGKGYLITSISHTATQPGPFTGGAQAATYSNSFTCIPRDSQYRPPRTTPQPLLSSVQTAVVVGPAGDEIYTDEYGRVKVQFHWDREGKKDQNTSCWLRVSQLHAGKGFGGISIPRIGEEVVVAFLEGDLDQPIIAGRVYHKESMPPFKLPANKSISGIRTHSTLGGSADNFNEIHFEDKKGSEVMYLHAEKDQNTVVENDQSMVVGRDRSVDVGRDKSEHVARNKTIKIDGGHTETITKSMTINIGSTLTETVAVNYAETVGAAMELTVGAALAITVGGGMAETVGVAKAETIGGSKTESIGTNKSLSTGGFLSEKVGKDRTVDIVKNLKEKIGGQHTENVTKEYMLNAKKVTIVAKDEIQIKVGSAELTMKKNGDITLKGKKINVKGSSDVIIKGSKIQEN